jgi:hypothetical protein
MKKIATGNPASPQNVTGLSPINRAVRMSRYTAPPKSCIVPHASQTTRGFGGMATRKSDCHYLRTNIERSEPRKYASLEGAMAAMKDLLHLQGGRGFVTTREPDGKHSSRHPDGRGVQFWAEDARGVIVS